MSLSVLVLGLAASLNAVTAWAQPGRPVERVEADVSSRRIAIESDFAGIQVVVFGAVDQSQQRFAEQGLYDIVIAVRGPTEPAVVRRKARIFGIWVNQVSQTFISVPEYYAVLSSRPLNEIASEKMLAERRLGFKHLRFSAANGTLPNDEEEAFRKALIRIKQDQNLYQERDFAVAFISRSLFRATVSVPANVPVGIFDVEIFLFREGRLIDTHTTEVKIAKSGLERFVFNLAYEHSLIYGLGGVIIAILAGLAASAGFRKS